MMTDQAMEQTNNETTAGRSGFPAWPIIVGFLIIEALIIWKGYEPWQINRHHSMGKKLVREGKLEQGIQHYLWLHNKYPQSKTINLELGLAYLRAGNNEEAIRHLTNVSDEAPPLPEVKTNLGLAYERTGDPETALTYFEQGVTENPSDPVANFYIGEEWFRRGEYLKAAPFFERATAHPEYRDKALARQEQIEKEIFGDLAEAE